METVNDSQTSKVEKLHSNPSWEQIQQAFLATADASPVLSGLTELIDGMVIQAYQASIAPVFPSGVAMVAVGGFAVPNICSNSLAVMDLSPLQMRGIW